MKNKTEAVVAAIAFMSVLIIVIVMLMMKKPAVLIPVTTGDSGYPCGIHGISCGNHMCCNEGEVCGGGQFNGCPAGQCCYTGEDTLGAKKPHPQMAEDAGR